MNYTRPNASDHKDSPEDWLHGALIFARALSIVLEEGVGIVVDLKGDMMCPGQPAAKKVVVYRLNEKIHIDPIEKDWEEGTYLGVSE